VAKKQSWGLIILGVVIFAVVVLVGAVGIGGYVIYRQFAIHSAVTEPATAEQELSKTLARFGSEKPYIELRDDDEPVINRDKERAETRSIQALHVFVWNPRDRKSFTMELPMWMLRFMGNKPITMSGSDADVRLHITVNDLEHHGPGLIMNHTSRHGERIVVWAE